MQEEALKDESAEHTSAPASLEAATATTEDVRRVHPFIKIGRRRGCVKNARRLLGSVATVASVPKRKVRLHGEKIGEGVALLIGQIAIAVRVHHALAL